MIRSVLIGCLVAVAPVAFGGGLNQKLVPAGAKWLLHLDGEAFRKTKIGKMVIEERAEPEVHKAEKEAKTNFDFSFNKIMGVTAFGSLVGEGGEKDAVLVVETTADVRGDLSKLIAMNELSGAKEATVTKLHNGGVDLYKIGGDLNLMPAGQNLWLLSKSKVAVEAAREVALGKAAALTENDFMKFPTVENSFFFMAAADMDAKGARLPAQARILQKADGGRILIGEKGDNLFLNFALKSRDLDTIAQIKEVLQGLKALVALGMSGDPDVAALTSSASITSTDNIVSVNLSYPLGRAMKKVQEDK